MSESKLSRRLFLEGAAAGVTAAGIVQGAEVPDPRLEEAIRALEYLTPPERMRILDKGKAGVATLPQEKLREAGLVPETWSLEVVPDPASTSVVENPLSRERGRALDWNGLMKLAERHAVRFVQVCTCTNGADPFHVSLWGGGAAARNPVAGAAEGERPQNLLSELPP